MCGNDDVLGWFAFEGRRLARLVPVGLVTIVDFRFRGALFFAFLRLRPPVCCGAIFFAIWRAMCFPAAKVRSLAAAFKCGFAT